MACFFISVNVWSEQILKNKFRRSETSELIAELR